MAIPAARLLCEQGYEIEWVVGELFDRYWSAIRWIN